MTKQQLKRWIANFTLFTLAGFFAIAIAATPEDLSTAPPLVVADASNDLSFNFQSINTRALVQLIAKNSGLNVVISDAVKGDMSLYLQHVTWQQALEIVLKANGLAKRQYGNILLIGPIQDIATNEAKQLQAELQLADLAPLSSMIVHLKYANAADLALVIKGAQSSLLSTRGQIGVDARTNSIWLRDSKTHLNQVVAFIRKLDIPARQVLIEVRIVSVDTEYSKELGVRFGWSVPNNQSGTLAGANEMANGTSVSEVPIPERLNFNVPAANIFGQPAGSIGLALMRVGNNFLDLELSALEGERRAEVISNPRVITSNQQKASIQTGEEIPYQEATSSGATSIVFKKAVLSLEITPQITPDNHIILDLGVTQNKRGTNTQTGTTQVPSIDTQEVHSHVFLNNSETVVVGGVYKINKLNHVERIPLLGTLPYVGNLFTHKSISNVRNELLVFITPKIIEQNRCAHTMTKDEMQMNRLSHFPVEDKPGPA